jgi:hypothetical protein
VATVKLDESPPSRDKMLHYVKGFMARFASCVQEQADRAERDHGARKSSAI